MAIPDFYIGTGALNLGPRACIANTLPHWAVSPASLPKVSHNNQMRLLKWNCLINLVGGIIFSMLGIKPKEGINHQHYFTLLVLSFRRGSHYAVQSGSNWAPPTISLSSAEITSMQPPCLAWKCLWKHTHNGSTCDSKRLCGTTSCVPRAGVWGCKTAKTAAIWFTCEHLLLRPRTL